MTQEAQQPLTASAPSWVLPALMLMVGGGGGYLGRSVVSDQEPAVLAAGVSSVREDLQDLKRDVAALRQDVARSSSDRWTRTDHITWARSDVEPLRTALDEHVRLTGHPGGMRAIEQIDGTKARRSRATKVLIGGVSDMAEAAPGFSLAAGRALLGALDDAQRAFVDGSGDAASLLAVVDTLAVSSPLIAAARDTIAGELAPWLGAL